MSRLRKRQPIESRTCLRPALRSIALAAVSVTVAGLVYATLGLVGPASASGASGSVRGGALDCLPPPGTARSFHNSGAINWNSFLQPQGALKAIMLFVD